MSVINELFTLPSNLPKPVDDGACDHLEGVKLPSIPLISTNGLWVDLSCVPGRVVIFAYPRTGQPGIPALVDNWNDIPGARGCTPHVCSYRDLADAFQAENVEIYGLSTQGSEYQIELAFRLNLPFQILSDAELKLTNALCLPTFTVSGYILIRRMAWVVDFGRITKVFYPVFPPDENATHVLKWIRENPLVIGR
jgi:peroxiredoxin